MASSPGHAGRSNEDVAGAVPGAAVLLDGAGGIPGAEAVCHHGVAWYARRLAAALLEQLLREPGVELVTALEGAIADVADAHRPSCDIASPISPHAGVAVVRFAQDRVDHLVLGDAFVAFDLAGADPLVVTDPREVRVRSECTAVLQGVAEGTPEHEVLMGSVRAAFRAKRNHPDGFWVAKDDPHAAGQAVTGSVPLERVRGVALLSNGASRLVTPYDLVDWPALFDVLRASGPEEVLRRVREVEADPPVTAAGSDRYASDDATAVFCEPAA